MDSGSSSLSGFALPSSGPSSASTAPESQQARPQISSSCSSGGGSRAALHSSKPHNSINGGTGLHSCVVRIRAEDQHLADDIVEGLEFAKDRVTMIHLASHVNDIFLNSDRSQAYFHPRRLSNPSPLGSNSKPSPLMGMIRC